MADILSASDIAQIKTVIENALAKATNQGDRAGRAAETERARQMARALLAEGQNLTAAQAFDELFKRLADNPVHPLDTAAELVAQPMVDPARFVTTFNEPKTNDTGGPFDDNSPAAIAERRILELERRIRDADREVPRPSILRAEAPAVEPLPEPKPEKHARKK